MIEALNKLETEISRDGELGREAALDVLDSDKIPLSGLLALTDSLRLRSKGRKVRLCSIVNARSGACGEDCAFCAQSASWSTGVKRYPLMDPSALAESAQQAYERGAGEFSIVTSGGGVNREREVAVLEQALQRITREHPGRERCASLGKLDRNSLRRLHEAGLNCFHHNLETSRDFFPGFVPRTAAKNA